MRYGCQLSVLRARSAAVPNWLTLDMCNVSPITGLASKGSSLREMAAELAIYTCSPTAHRLTEQSVMAVVSRAVAARLRCFTWGRRFSPSARSERGHVVGGAHPSRGTTALSLSLLGRCLCVLRSPRVRDMVRSNTRPLPHLPLKRHGRRRASGVLAHFHQLSP